MGINQSDRIDNFYFISNEAKKHRHSITVPSSFYEHKNECALNLQFYVEKTSNLPRDKMGETMTNIFNRPVRNAASLRRAELGKNTRQGCPSIYFSFLK